MNRTRYSRVVVFGIDGMGNYNLRTETPNMDRIFANGAITYHALSMSPTISAQNWSSMLLGASPEVHRYTNSTLGRIPHDHSFLPSLFARIRAAMPDATLISCSEWDAINGLFEGIDDVTALTAPDSTALMELARDCAKQAPTVLFVQLEDPDKAGHHTEFGSEEYLAAIRLDDGYLGEIYEIYRESGMLDDTLFLMITDHGGIRCGHGGYTDEEKYITLGAVGHSVPKGTIGDACTRDLSAIVLYALGIDVPAYDERGFSSQIPSGIFPEINGSYYSVIPRAIEFSPRETPALTAEDGLYSYIDAHRVRVALFCDNTMTNAAEKHEAHTHNLPKYYSAGVTGARAELGRTGYVTFPDLKLGTHSFSVAVWLKVDRSLDEGVVVFANKDWFWKTRKSLGVGLSFRANDTVFSIGNGDDQEEFMAALPADTADDGWVHVVAVVDKKNMVYRLYYNFRPVIVLDIPEEYREIGDSDLPFTVGNDGTGTFSNEKYDLIVNLDDFFLIDGALTDVEVLAFGGYYGM